MLQFLFPTLPNGPIPSFTASPEDRNVQTSVESMHERKKLMADLSGGFVGLPGGYGTLEEVAEMTTWTQLGIRESFCAREGGREGADDGRSETCVPCLRRGRGTDEA